MRRYFALAIALLFAAVSLAAPATPEPLQNGLFSVAIEDFTGLCANVSHYQGFTVIEFRPPDQTAQFQSYDGEMRITEDTIYVTEEEPGYTAIYEIRYKFPFTAHGQIVFNGRSYYLSDLNTLNSYCNNQGTVFSSVIHPTDGTPEVPPPPPPLTVTAQASVTSGFAPLAVSLTATASKANVTYVWRDNGAQFATGESATITFANPSTHQLTVTATGENETATASLIVSVKKKPVGGSGGNGN